MFRALGPPHRYLEADPLETLDWSFGGALWIATIIDISTCLTILRPVADDVIGQHQHAMGYGDCGFLHPGM